jgi:hypothetical protein
VQQTFFGSSVDSLILLIINSLMTQGDLKQEDLTSKLVCFDANGVIIFQGFRSRVTVHI